MTKRGEKCHKKAKKKWKKSNDTLAVAQLATHVPHWSLFLLLLKCFNSPFLCSFSTQQIASNSISYSIRFVLIHYTKNFEFPLVILAHWLHHTHSHCMSRRFVAQRKKSSKSWLWTPEFHWHRDRESHVVVARKRDKSPQEHIHIRKWQLGDNNKKQSTLSSSWSSKSHDVDKPATECSAIGINCLQVAHVL